MGCAMVQILWTDVLSVGGSGICCRPGLARFVREDEGVNGLHRKDLLNHQDCNKTYLYSRARGFGHGHEHCLETHGA